jgi:hypothetical protein
LKKEREMTNQRIRQVNLLALSGSILWLTVVVAAAETPTSIPSPVQDKSWVAVTGADTLHEFMSGLRAERELANGALSTAEYHADGTGILHAWGASIPRTWEVRGEDRLCFTAQNETLCYTLEKKSGMKDLYRVREVVTETVYEFRVSNHRALPFGRPAEVGSKGGAAAPNVDEIAAELANPNTPLATLNAKLQFRTFQGDLPNADDQESMTLLLQPSFPFPLPNGDLIFFRPAIPLLINQPVFEEDTLDFDDKFGLGDIAYDLAYGRTTDTGWIVAGGLISTIPTATKDELGPDRWTLGPEVLLGKISKTYVVGAFPNHQWDVGGSGEADISLTTAQIFGVYLPGGGWNVGTTPIIAYDHEIKEWSLPLNITVGKTVMLNSRPWKIAMEINYFLAQPDAFGPEWFFGLNVGPVVENVVASWMGLSR